MNAQPRGTVACYSRDSRNDTLSPCSRWRCNHTASISPAVYSTICPILSTFPRARIHCIRTGAVLFRRGYANIQVLSAILRCVGYIAEKDCGVRQRAATPADSEQFSFIGKQNTSYSSREHIAKWVIPLVVAATAAATVVAAMRHFARPRRRFCATRRRIRGVLQTICERRVTPSTANNKLSTN